MSLSMLDRPARHGAPDNPTADDRHASWVTVATLAIVIAYVDGFVVTSLHGAVGDVASTQAPLLRWLRDSTMMLPSLVLSLLAALALSRRWARPSRDELVHLAVAAALVVAISTTVSIAEVAVNAASDYTTQASELAHAHGIHTITVAGQTAADSNSSGACTGLCASRHATLQAHIRGVGLASVVLLLTNVVLVVWVLAMRGGRLWADQSELTRGG